MASKKTSCAPINALAQLRERSPNEGWGFLRWFIPCLIAVATFVAFSPTLQNGFVNWDDPDNLVNNPHFRGLGWEQLAWMFTTFHMTLYRPLTWVTHGFDFLVWGMAPMGYHLTSLIFHVVNAVLVYFLSFRLLALALKQAAPSLPSLRISAGFAGLLFALHPLRVEAVAWASGRENVVAGFFLLLAMICYLRAVGDSSTSSSSYRKWLIAAWLNFALSLLSKVSGVTFPLVLLVLDIYPLKRLPPRVSGWFQSETRHVWWEKVPFGVLACGASVLGVLAKQRFGTVATLDDYGVLSRLNQSLYGLAFYVWKTVAPVELSPLYEKLAYLRQIGLIDIESGGFVIAVSGGLYLMKRRWPAGLASWICYVVILLPVLGIVPYGPQVVADRYSYIAVLGWTMLAGYGVQSIWHLKATRRLNQPGFLIFNGTSALILIALGVFTWREAQMWHDSERLWRHAISSDAKSSLARMNLGLHLVEQKKLAEAIEQLQVAVQLDPGSYDAHNHLGYALAAQGLADEAIQEFRKSIQISPNLPNAYNNLGNALADGGNLNQAAEQFHLAVGAAPEQADGYYNLARVLGKQGNVKDAIENYLLALRRKPQDPDIHNNLGLLYLREHRLDDAEAEFHKVLKVDRNYAKAYFNLGRVQALRGNLDDAVGSFEAALRLQPGVAEIHESLARVLAAKGNKEDALRHYQEALTILKAR
jgi:tetratricopeptide (TPR) repeat protein